VCCRQMQTGVQKKARRPCWGRPRLTRVSVQDRIRWDERYATSGPVTVGALGPPGVLAFHADAFPTTGHALDLACGQGAGAVWLAHRGLDVRAFDISPVAITQARELARLSGVADRCRFDVADLDDGLPVGHLSDWPDADVILCHKFRDRRLDQSIVERLAPGGLLAIAVLSEVDAAPGPFRAGPGELPAAFAELELVAAGEGQGYAWLLARGRRFSG
jgi:SAM-dependent methyltransferase